MKKQTEPSLSAEPAAIRKQFAALFDRTNKREAADRDVKRLRDMIREHQDLKLWKRMPGPGQAAINYLLQQHIAGAAISETWREYADHFKEELGHKSASQIELMLISHVVLCWLQLGFIELQYASVLNGAGLSLAQEAHWDRRVTLAQKRFTRATDALTRTRTMLAAARYANERADAAAAERTGRQGPRALTA